MEKIKIFVEDLLSSWGMSESAATVVRFVALVIIAVLLAWAAGYLCRKIVPLVGN